MLIGLFRIICFLIAGSFDILYWYTRSSTAGISVTGISMLAGSYILGSLVKIAHMQLQSGAFSFSVPDLIIMLYSFVLASLMLKAVTRAEIHWWKRLLPIVVLAPATHSERASQRVDSRTPLRFIMTVRSISLYCTLSWPQLIICACCSRHIWFFQVSYTWLIARITTSSGANTPSASRSRAQHLDSSIICRCTRCIRPPSLVGSFNLRWTTGWRHLRGCTKWPRASNSLRCFPLSLRDLRGLWASPRCRWGGLIMIFLRFCVIWALRSRRLVTRRWRVWMKTKIRNSAFPVNFILYL